MMLSPRGKYKHDVTYQKDHRTKVLQLPQVLIYKNISDLERTD